jgi:tetratricopeptide (TPR) repeat protein
MFWKRKKTRVNQLGAAGAARAKGKSKKAIILYMESLQNHPDDPEIQRKLAPLLVEQKQYNEAWKYFDAAAKTYLDKGHLDKCTSMYTQAVRQIPHKCEAWEAFADIKLKRGQKKEAFQTLSDGRKHFKGRKQRAEAVRLLRKTWDLAPWDYDISIDLAIQLLKLKKKDMALRLLVGLADRTKGEKLRIIRGKIFRNAPSFGSLWRWIRASATGK